MYMFLLISFLCLYSLYLQHELFRVLYPVYIHCFMDLVAKGHIQEGMLELLFFPISLHEDKLGKANHYYGSFFVLFFAPWLRFMLPLVVSFWSGLGCIFYSCSFLHNYGWYFQHEPFSIASVKTMKWCTCEIFKSWKEFFLHLIWRFVTIPELVTTNLFPIFDMVKFVS